MIFQNLHVQLMTPDRSHSVAHDTAIVVFLYGFEIFG
jgi:hypothetical protein